MAFDVLKTATRLSRLSGLGASPHLAEVVPGFPGMTAMTAMRGIYTYGDERRGSLNLNVEINI